MTRMDVGSDPPRTLLGRCLTILSEVPPGPEWDGELHVFDLDRDGRMDLIMPGNAGGSLIRYGDSTLEYATEDRVDEVQLDVGDIDGDGFGDLLSQEPAVWWGSAARSFEQTMIATMSRGVPTPGEYFSPGTQLAFLARTAEGLSIELVAGRVDNPRDLASRPTQMFDWDGMGGGPWLAADFDGDGFDDVAFGFLDMTIFFSHGDGSFEAPLVFQGAGYLVPGDVDGDGASEVLAVSETRPPLPMLVHIDRITDRKAVPLADIAFVRPFEPLKRDVAIPRPDATIHDLDGDGHPDLLLTEVLEEQVGDRYYSVLLLHAARGHGDGTFDTPEAATIARHELPRESLVRGIWTRLAAADVNGDGTIELVVGRGDSEPAEASPQVGSVYIMSFDSCSD